MKDTITLFECWNCAGIFTQEQLDMIDDFAERVEEGEELPEGQCPDCGALCYPVLFKRVDND